VVENPMIKFFLGNRFKIAAVVLLILIALCLRFYRLPEYMTFLGDEGRDALVIKKILVYHDFPLLGPPTSVGNMYLGPLYYYMMAVPMAIFWMNPVAAAGMVAVIGTLAVALVFVLARRWFGFLPAILSAFLYAVSPVNIIYSRSSWNPNPAPFFALLAIWGLDQARRKANFYWFTLTGMALAFAVQMHYLALILLPIFGLFWIYELVRQKKSRVYPNFIGGTVGAIAGFLILMSPLLIFDFKYNFLNFRGLQQMFGQGSGSVGLSLWDNLMRLAPVYTEKLIGRYLGAGNLPLSLLLSALILLPLILIVARKIKISWPYFALGVWLLGGILGLSLYRQEIYDHYLGFLNPAPFLLLGGVVALLKNKQRLMAVSSLAVILGFLNLVQNPLFASPGEQLRRTQEISRFVIAQSGGQPFNFALIAKSNYDAAYQFYLDLYGHKPATVPIEITDQLFVVCEDQVCNPVGHPKYEIAGFGMTKIDKEEEFDGVKVYRLIHNPSGAP
jgi:4-amino-4-deoxy-L-arabinose transferase-like glycosyltransferase